MKEAGAGWVEGDGWWGDGTTEPDTGVSSIASAQEDGEGNVMLQVESRTDWEAADTRAEKQLRFHLSPIDAIAYAERIRAAAIDAMQGVAQDPKSELTP